MVHLSFLIAFCEVVKCESFTEAARRLHLTQSSVSKQVSEVEKAFGTTLLERTNAGVQLTTEGRIVYPFLVGMLEHYEQAKDQIQQYIGNPQGVLHVGATFSIGNGLLPQAIAEFNKQYPNITINARIMNSHDAVQTVLNGGFGMALVEGLVDSKGVEALPFAEDELVLVVPANHPWYDRTSVTPEDLTNERWIVREEGSGTRKIMEFYLREAGVFDRLYIAGEFGSTGSVKAAIMSGLGLSMVSDMAVRYELEMGLMKAVRIEGITMKRSLLLVRQKRRQQPLLVQLFSEFLRRRRQKRRLGVV